jgi:hypothetical protein
MCRHAQPRLDEGARASGAGESLLVHSASSLPHHSARGRAVSIGYTSRPGSSTCDMKLSSRGHAFMHYWPIETLERQVDHGTSPDLAQSEWN